MAKPYIVRKRNILSPKIADNILLYPHGQTMSSIKRWLLESLQCREYNAVILTVCLLYNNGQVILCERTVSPRQYAVWRWSRTVKWDSLCWAAFKQGHRKLMNGRNCAILDTLYNFWLLTSASSIYSWTYHIPFKSILYPRDNEVHSRTIK